MFRYKLEPRFCDTDALGHISNTAFPVWFEQARVPVFRIFHPSLDVQTWPLILARIEVDMKAQTYWSSEVEIVTRVGRLGRSSCEVLQEAWQNDRQVATGKAVLIYFDYETESSREIPESIREQLTQHQAPSD